MATSSTSVKTLAPGSKVQGIQVAQAVIDPAEFFAQTRRQRFLMGQIAALQGFSGVDEFNVLKAGVLSQLSLRIYGTVTVALNGGTCATTSLWPYGFLSNINVSANGMSSLLSGDGWFFKAGAITDRWPISDRGVTNSVNGANVNQGTLALASENWGLGCAETGIASGTYDVDLQIPLNVAWDMVKTLQGSIFAQTNSTAIQVTLTEAAQTALFTVAGGATVTLALSATLESTTYEIPTSNGTMILPDLSVFHQFTQVKAPNAISQGQNEITLAGQGVDRHLMRILFRVFSNGAPLEMSAANFGPIGWKWGGNETPEQWQDGASQRHWSEQLYNSDIGGPMGFGAFDYSTLWADRDEVDLGQLTEARFVFNLVGAPTSPYCSYAQDVLVPGAIETGNS